MTRLTHVSRSGFAWEDFSPRRGSLPCETSCPLLREAEFVEEATGAQVCEVIAEDWNEALRAAVRELATSIRPSDVPRLDRLEQRVAELENLPEPIMVPINTFAPEPFEPIRAFFVVVEPVVAERSEDCEYVATLVDAEIAASGDTVGAAVLHLKDRLLAVFDMLEGMPNARLGKRPKRQLAVLQSVIRRVV